MKPILAWLKKNWIIPSLCLCSLVVLGVTWWFSSAWNEQIQSEQQKAASDLLNKVTSINVTYALPMVAGQDKAIEQKSPPNAFLTSKYAERKKLILEQREGVVKLAEAFNKGDKKPLIDGIFPAPASGQELLKPLELAQKLVGNPSQNIRSAYQELLDSVRAGGPVVSSQLEQQINDVNRRESEKIRGAMPTRELTASEKENLSRLLIDTRRSEYVRRANEISLYADMSCFPGASAATAVPAGTSAPATVAGPNQILTSIPATPPSVRQAFFWQTDYWMLQDIFAIIRNANMGSDGKLTSERNSVVKRIEKIELLPWKVQSVAEAATPGGTADPAQAGSPGGEFKDSITGHTDTPGASTYDTRRARVTLIVSSAKLPELFDAIGRTNFAYVVGFAMDRVDGWQDLAQGYYYGDENVVRILIDLELTWLRSWSEPYFPVAVRKALGLPDLAPPAPPAGEQPPK
ncbi:MAG: hypothetical protein U0573_05285 [Phycisphaerales bacterium]|nr:hypothetical protein [Planctomycetota bacterium]